MLFSDLGLSPEVLKAVEDAGYTQPTPIQEQAIPHVLMGRDMLGLAQTGTGKTASFTLPMIDILSAGKAKARMPRSLILEPTRELADQVATPFAPSGPSCPISLALLIGGMSFSDQEKKLDRGVDVLIATPGRLLDHFERGKVMLSGVKVLVIDEADRMMDMGFIPDLERIVSLLPPLRQTLFFSATMSPEMRRLADSFLTNPREVKVAPPASPAANVQQGLLTVAREDKRDALCRLIAGEQVKNALIFCNRKRDVDILSKSLKKHGFDAAALHGDMAQAARMEVLARFKASELTLLVASDVAARGLDVQGLSHVFNYDVPMHAEDYIHRIGRTGRAGMTGRALTLATPEDGKYVAAITRLLGKDIPPIVLDGIAVPEGEALESERPRRRGARAASKAGPAERKPRSRKRTTDDGAAPDTRSPEPASLATETPPEPVAERTISPPARAAALSTADRDFSLPDRVPESAVPRSDHRPAAAASHRHRSSGRDDSPTAIGFGDHIPAFMLQPGRPAAD